MLPSVLVLDGETRAALAVTRSLGARGLTVRVASPKTRVIAGASRYCTQLLSCPSPLSHPLDFRSWCMEQAKALSPVVLLPITDGSLLEVLACGDVLRASAYLPFVSEDLVRSISDKANLMKIASSFGLRSPKTLQLSSGDLLNETILAELKQFPFPAVLKPSFSVSTIGDQRAKVDISYVDNSNAVVQALRERIPEGIKMLLQQKIIGEGYGVFALCSRGETLTTFAHHRVLEKPPSGGVSVLSESVNICDVPLPETRKLLKHFSWEGVAMVEFKRTSANEFYLIEVNPRFWGSLQLAIDSGRDFPWLLYRYVTAEKPAEREALARELAELKDYRVGARLRWSLGSLDHLLIRLKREGLPAMRDLMLHNALHLDLQPGRTKSEILRLRDPKPFFVEIANWLTEASRGVIT